MSTLQTTNVKHPDAAGNQIVFTSGGDINFDNGAVYLDSANNRLGIGSTVPQAALVVSKSGEDGVEFIPQQTTATNQVLHYNRNTSAYSIVDTRAAQHIFRVGGSEATRIDASSRLLVGTSTAPTDSANGAHYSKLISVGNTASSSGDGRLALCRGNTAANLSSGSGIGELHFADSAGGGFASISAFADATPGTNDYPGRLVFSTSADGESSPTEKMRIDSRGTTKFSTSTSLSTRYSGNIYHLSHNHNNGNTVHIFEHSGGVSPYGIYLQFSGASPDNTTQYFISCEDTVAHRFYVMSDGDVVNHDNSYGAISDVKLKQDIVDSGSQWDDLKNLRVRKFKFKSDVEAYGDEAKTLIGLVAQEAELVSPGLVKESPDMDADNNDLGTTTKSVNYSVLYMKAIKALQEAIERIETLEQRLSDAGIA
jgi:hypothetical protein